MADFDAVPTLGDAPLPTFNPGSYEGQIWTSNNIPPLIGATVNRDMGPLPVELTKHNEIKKFRTRQYWTAVVGARDNLIPQHIDRGQLIANLSMSPATNARYPHTHLWWRRNDGNVATGVGKPRKLVRPVAEWAGGRRNWFDGPVADIPPILPQQIDLWTMFIMGSTVGKGDRGVVVHFALSQRLRQWMQKAKLQVFVPAINIPLLTESDAWFWCHHVTTLYLPREDGVATRHGPQIRWLETEERSGGGHWAQDAF
ncbi:hypothetical protein OQA88_7948 [Cercophora sp. LCS_1]